MIGNNIELDIRNGQSIAGSYSFQDSISVDLQGKQIVFKSQDGQTEQLRLSMQENQLTFSVYNEIIQDWEAPKYLTPSETNTISNKLPPDNALDFVVITADGAEFTNNGRQTLKIRDLAGTSLCADMSNNNTINFINSTNDYTVAQFGQGQIKCPGSRISLIADPMDIQDATTKGWVQSQCDLRQPLSQKGVANGYAPLDQNAMVPIENLPVMKINEIFVGLDNDKINPIFYSAPPTVGTVFVATDTKTTYILSAEDYSLALNWVAVTYTIPVQSVNGYIGAVSLTSDDVQESTVNLYFASGISQYLNSAANLGNQLLKLNSNALIDSQFIDNTFRTHNGAVTLFDNQSDTLTFQDSVSQIKIFDINKSFMNAYSKLKYSSAKTIDDELDLVYRGFTDETYYKSTVPLNGITVAESEVNLNGNKIANLQPGTNPQDAVTKSQLDTKYDNTTPLNLIENPTGNLSLNNFRITGLQPGTDALDAVNKQQFDYDLSMKMDAIRSLSYISITNPNLQYVHMAGQQLKHMAAGSDSNDAVTLNQLDTKYDKTTRLDQIVLAAASVDLNGQRIVNVATAPSSDYDSANVKYVNDSIQNNVYQIINQQNPSSGLMADATQITNKNTPLNMNSQQIQGLFPGSSPDHAVNKQQLDTKPDIYAQNGTTGLLCSDDRVEVVSQQTIQVDLNQNKLTGLPNPSSSTDAVNLQYADQTYVAQASPLNQLLPPSNSLNLNYQKIINVATPTSQQDASNKSYVDEQISNSVYQIQNQTSSQSQLVANLNELTNGSTPLNMNSQPIKFVSDGVNATDAVNKQQLDTKYDITTPLNEIKLATDDLSLNGYKITNLAAPTDPTQATNKTYVDSKSINDLSAQTQDYSANNNKLTGLKDATQATDAINLQTGDGRYYLNTTTLNEIQPPQFDVSMNSQKITQLANPVSGSDALNLGTADSKYCPISRSLDQIPTATSQVSLGGQKITDLGNATLDSDAMNRQSADSRYYLNTATLSDIQSPANHVNLNNKQINNLADATSSTDAMNRQSSDARYYLNTYTLSDIYIPTNNVDLNNKQINNLADATSSTDAMNRQSSDARYYLNTYTLSDIQQPVNNVNLNNKQINNLADATASTDAMNRQSADARYYLNITTLDQIQPPTANISVNQQKITNLADPVDPFDALNLNSADAKYYSNQAPLNQIIKPSAQVDFNFQNIINVQSLTDQNGDLYATQGYVNQITLNNVAKADGSVDLNSQKIINLGDPLLPKDAVHLQYTQDNFVLITTPLQNITKCTGNLDVNGNSVVGVSMITDTLDPDYSHQAVSLDYFKNQSLSNISDNIPNTGDISINHFQIKDLAAPTQQNDAATKAYVDSQTSVGNATQIANTDNAQSYIMAQQTQIMNGSTPLNMNLQPITNVANATQNEDALNLQTGDTRYHLKTDTLNSIQINAPIDANLNLGQYTAITSKTTGFVSSELIPKAYADATYGTASFPVGAIIAWFSNLIPSGWLICDGSSFSSAVYPDLSIILGSTTLPDLRGYFLRGLDARSSGAVDPSAPRTIGSIQTSNNLSHTHQYQDVVLSETFSGATPAISVRGSNGGSDNSGNQFLWRTSSNGTSINGTDSSTFIDVTQTGTSEARPINKAVHYIIRALATPSYITGVMPSNGNIDLLGTYKVQNSINPTSLNDLINVAYLKSLIKQRDYVQLICNNNFPALNTYFNNSNWTNKQVLQGQYITYSTSTGYVTLAENQTYEIQVSYTSNSNNTAVPLLFNPDTGNRIATELLGINVSSASNADPWWVEIRSHQSGGWAGRGPTIIVTPTSSVPIAVRITGQVPASTSTFMLQIKVSSDYFITQSSI